MFTHCSAAWCTEHRQSRLVTQQHLKTFENKMISVSLLILSFISTVFGDEFYSLKATDILGKHVVEFDSFRGKVLLIVNVASECGFTDSHYKELQRLQEILGHDDRFLVLGFPCNQFGGQEPAENHEILDFVTKKYSVDFPMFGKVNVIGSNAHPIWKHLVDQSGVAPEWNFYKYLVSHTGKVVHVYSPKTSVKSIFNSIESLVKAARDFGMKASVKKDLKTEL